MRDQLPIPLFFVLLGAGIYMGRRVRAMYKKIWQNPEYYASQTDSFPFNKVAFVRLFGRMGYYSFSIGILMLGGVLLFVGIVIAYGFIMGLF